MPAQIVDPARHPLVAAPALINQGDRPHELGRDVQ
jgi:hypothetical protein